MYDQTGDTFIGSNVLVSGAHAVLPGEALSVGMASIGDQFSVADPDTMHYLPNPPNPARSQARIDVYDAGNPGFPTAALLRAAVFDPTNIQAVPYLGNLLGDAGIVADTIRISLTTLTFSLAPYVGKTVYFAYRTSNNVPFTYAIALTDFTVS